MDNCVKFKGKIVFDPEVITSKQERHSEWKKSALILFESDNHHKGITDYYAWFIKKRYNLILQKPIRGAHVTLVNDRASETNGKWEEVKKKWNGKEIEVTVHVDPFLGIQNRQGNFEDWWLTVPYQFRDQLHSIRQELGLSKKPYFGFHMTIGTAVNFYPRLEKGVNAAKAKGMFEEHSEYVLKMNKKKAIKKIIDEENKHK